MATDWLVVTWVDDDGQTWRVLREVGMWRLMRYAPDAGQWERRGLYLSRDEAMAAASDPHVAHALPRF